MIQRMHGVIVALILWERWKEGMSWLVKDKVIGPGLYLQHNLELVWRTSSDHCLPSKLSSPAKRKTQNNERQRCNYPLTSAQTSMHDSVKSYLNDRKRAQKDKIMLLNKLRTQHLRSLSTSCRSSAPATSPSCPGSPIRASKPPLSMTTLKDSFSNCEK